MKVCIKRGAKEIGGSAVELTADCGERIVIDLGLPLDAEENKKSLLPDIKGLREKTDDLLGVLISHAHQDHYALIKHINTDIPVYMSAAMAKIMDVCAEYHLPNAFVFKNKRIYEGNKPFQIGSFTITPYLVDHAAYAAYAFLIEADGKRLFYSGDFRAHGRKGRLFEAMVHYPPQNIDVLLMEGSCLGREQSEKYPSEDDLEEAFVKVFQRTSGLCVVQSSSQNIDRVVTLYRAAKKCGRTLVMSGYAGRVLMCLHNKNLPNFTREDVKKFVSEKHKPHEITLETISEAPEKYVIMLNQFIFERLKNSLILNDTAYFIYSMWNGYKEKYKERLDLMQEKNVPMIDIHTSGHADIPTLKRFAKALNPKKLVPIHTFAPDSFARLFENVEIHNDNETFEV